MGGYCAAFLTNFDPAVWGARSTATVDEASNVGSISRIIVKPSITMQATRRGTLGMFLATAFSPSLAATPIAEDDIAAALAVRIDQQKRGTKAVVGILTRQSRRIVAHGGASADGVFEIASLTKIFTALMLAEAAQRGEVGLDDPLSLYEAHVPSFDGRAITLEDLAVHGAGLPLRPPNLEARPGNFDKYAGYTLQQLRDSLKGYALPRRPGERFEYSNWGYGLLGDALARRTHLSYFDLLRERIIAPLAMGSTAIEPTQAMTSRLVQGHDDRLRPLPPTSDGALSPAGGLKSTANDLLTFLGIFVCEHPRNLVGASLLMRQIDRPGDDATTRMALGWRRSPGSAGPYYWSNGRADGHRAFMGFNPQTGVGVVAMVDAGSGPGVDDIGRRVLDPNSPIDLVPRVFHTEISMTAAQLDRYVGTYEYAPDDRLVLTRDGDMLVFQAGSSRLEVRPEGGERFFFPDFDGALLVFALDGKSVELRQDGQVYVYRRVP